MSLLRTVPIAAAFALLAPSLASAQNAAPPGMQDKPTSLQQGGGNSGASQDGGMGATGWSGPHRGQTSPGGPEGADPSPSSDKQPPVATGADLKGAPEAFPSNRAPE
jgi:hypothetical protein